MENEKQAKPKNSHRIRRRVLIALGAVALAVAVAAGAIWAYLNSIMQAIRPESGTASIAQQVQTEPEYSGEVVSVLICGIDYEEGRTYGSVNDGLTDLILYFQFDVKNGKINMLQIPRNTLLGESVTCTSTTGKTYRASNYQINSIMKTDDQGIAALADVIADQFKLPVDYYASIDMDGLKELITRFNGLDVYIPQDLVDEYGNTLEQGYRHLDAETCEFFLRNRHSYANEDVGRLNTQRYFYSALFKRVRTANLAEIIKLTPVVTYFVHTDMPAEELIALAYTFLSIDSEDIMIAQLPMYANKNYKGQSCLLPARQEIADLLNTYYRTYTGEVTADELNLSDDLLECTGGITDAKVQFMGQLDSDAEAASASAAG